VIHARSRRTFVAMAIIGTTWLIPATLAARSAASADASPSTTRAPDADTSRDDFACGPRCVQYVLRHYGSSVDLVDLIRELQWSDFSRGTTLAEIQGVLERRGLYTAAIRINDLARLRWRHPVVLHLARTRNEIGHYVVWLRNRRTQQVVWNGLMGEIELPDALPGLPFSGAVLLTAPSPITHPESALASPRPFLALLLLALGLCAMGEGCRRAWLRRVSVRSHGCCTCGKGEKNVTRSV